MPLILTIDNDPSIVKTRFLIVRDTKDLEVEVLPGYSIPANIDVVLHCGDLEETCKTLEDYTKFLQMMAQIPAGLKLSFVENRRVHDSYPNVVLGASSDAAIEQIRDPGERIRRRLAMHMSPGDRVVEAGLTWLETGYQEFELSNGGKFSIFTPPQRPHSHATPSEDSFTSGEDSDRSNSSPRAENPRLSIAQRPAPAIPSIDIIMTHRPLKGVLDGSYPGLGSDVILKDVSRARPLLHCFGHLLAAQGAEMIGWPFKVTGQEKGDINGTFHMNNRYPVAYEDPIHRPIKTLTVNAAFGLVNNELTRLPSVVQLRLPRSTSD